ncbi:MAG: glycerate kinase [Firmicutes bacterium]|nr:glycerate kinase [Bacillota bacterium]
MKAVFAIDSMKGSLSSIEGGTAAAEGLKRVFPDAETIIRPLADGGEGTVDALVYAMDGKKVVATVTGPHGRPVDCEYGIIESSRTAVIEMSGAAGITMVQGEERNPLLTTTFGVGEVIKDAIEKGCRRFIVGIGGSATNDGGIGMLQALGFGFYDKDGNEIEHAGRGLGDLASISLENALPVLKDGVFRVACDVNNPLCGDLGCSAIYGPQKGATPEIVKTMDAWMGKYAEIAKAVIPEADDKYPGAGAAGGLGFAFKTFLGGILESGIGIVLDETKLEKFLDGADVVVTGEGRLDGQTAMGKAPAGVAGLAKKYGIPVIAFAGGVTKDATACNGVGIDAFFPILRGICTLEEAMKIENARANMADTAEQVFRLFALGCK